MTNGNRDAPQEDWTGLLRAALAGDAAAYATFLRAVAPVLRGIVRARAGGIDPARQEDVVQEVLLAIHLKRQTWDTSQPVRPWVYAITRHKVIDALRRQGRAVHVPVEEFGEVLAAEAAPDPFETRDALRLIARLDDRSAALLRAVAVNGATPEAAAAALGLSPGAGRVALHRALKRLAALRAGEVE
jgi:RNA polymerase sigma-70 factor (ECF subfamily)